MIQQWLSRSSKPVFITYAIIAAFGTYFCMYAYRKPFTVATYEGMSFVGVDYKIWLIIVQVVGYMLSKFIGIKIISEMGRRGRLIWLLGLIGIAEVALLLFALIPPPYNIICLFFNGLPLGMIWGIVFSYLEGRTFSEVLGAGLSASFIVSSGAVKSVGKTLMDTWEVSAFWMPFLTGIIFAAPLLLFAWLLDQLPAPTAEDERERTARQPMNAAERLAFFKQLAPGLTVLIFFYILLTAYRDFRDNFAAEIWDALGYGDVPAVFTLAELPIALSVLIMLGATMFIRNNRFAFMLYHGILLVSVALVGVSTWLFQAGIMPGGLWMVCVGLGLYLCYVPFNCILFDRMIAAFRIVANSGFLIYLADSFGYLGSVGVLLYKNFGQANLSWLQFFVQASYALTAIGVLTMLVSWMYFCRKVPHNQ
jgi:MFS family permease